MTRRLNISDVWVDPVNMDQALARVTDFIEKGDKPHCIFAVNPEKNFSVPKDPLLYETFKRADLLIPDGIGVVLAARVLHGIKLSRVPGVELMDNICRLSARKGYKIFIYGAREDINGSAADVLQKRYPELEIAGRSNGYVNDDQMGNLIRKINTSGAEVLFLALGSPKQEKWFAAHKGLLQKVRVCQGIGGTLDTIAGNVKRAPAIWQRCYVEWLYRLLAEPKRIRRQKVLPVFAAMIIMSKLKGLDCFSPPGR